MLEKVASSQLFSLWPVSRTVNSFSIPQFLQFCCPLPKFSVYMEASSLSEPNFHSEVCRLLHGGFSMNMNPTKRAVLEYLENIP